MCGSHHRHRSFDERQEHRPSDTVDAGLRASDADRQRVIDQLRTPRATAASPATTRRSAIASNADG